MMQESANENVQQDQERVSPGQSISTAPPCRELNEAWSILEEEDFERPAFVEKLQSLLPSLDKDWVRNAWLSYTDLFDMQSCDHVSRRTLQNVVYLPYFKLMKAAEGKYLKSRSCYKSQRDVSTSCKNYCEDTEHPLGFSPHKITIKPDAAVTLDNRWDPFTLLHIHMVYPNDEHSYHGGKDEPCIIDDDRSSLITLCTADFIQHCLQPEQYGEVALPFLIITGKLCSLYVTTLDSNGKSRIQVVGYPDGTTGMNHDLSKSPSKNNEMAAQEAAACDGMFTNVTYPFEQLYRLYSHKCQKQSISPFYFSGCPTSTPTVEVPTKVFLKVWKVTDIPFHAVEYERMHHKRAFDAGIPVAAPILDEIVRSKSSCGAEHFVFVTEYLDEDRVPSLKDLVHYSVSLMETVLQLHNKAGMLHCSLKPDNVQWNTKGVIKLIDFEMAQNIVDARWMMPGPVGFPAPEVLKKLPCSTKTDAYSVGKTILARLDRLMDHTKKAEPDITNMLHDIATKLSEDDAGTRWSLEQALGQLEERTKPLVPTLRKKRSAESEIAHATRSNKKK